MSGLTAGTGRSLRALKTGYIATTLRSPVTIGAGLVNGPFFDALVKARPTGDASLVLDWKTMDPWEKDDAGACTGPCLGYEFDLWLKDPSGTYYGDDHEGALSTPPYIFYPRNSYSNVLFTSEACVPMETIIIGDPASNGVYKVFVDRYVSSSRFNQTYAGSQIQFQAFNGTTAIPGAVNLRCPCTTQQYWYIGDINKSDSIYTWTSKNLCPVVKP
jgi:hypothetical protein